MLCYWATTNVISLAQVGLLRVPVVRDYFGMERLRKFTPAELPVKKKTFLEGFNEARTNLSITRELQNRQHYANQLHSSATGPPQKTFKFDPTRQTPPKIK